MRIMKVPDKVYLQFWGDTDRPEDELIDADWEVSWCDDQINDSDICYVREDKRDSEHAATQSRDRVRELEDALKAIAQMSGGYPTNDYASGWTAGIGECASFARAALEGK